MDGPDPVLNYATPSPTKTWSQTLREPVGSDRLLTVPQVMGAAVALVVVLLWFARFGYSAGPWPTRLAWAWLPGGAAVANVVAAWAADRAAAADHGPRAVRLRRWYVGLCVANLGAVVAALIVVATWPSYVIVEPWSPPVNDRLFVFDRDLYVKGTAWLLVLNQALFLPRAVGRFSPR